VSTIDFGNFITKNAFTIKQALGIILNVGFEYVELLSMTGYFEDLLIDKNDIYKPLELSKEHNKHNIKISSITTIMRC